CRVWRVFLVERPEFVPRRRLPLGTLLRTPIDCVGDGGARCERQCPEGGAFEQQVAAAEWLGHGRLYTPHGKGNPAPRPSYFRPPVSTGSQNLRPASDSCSPVASLAFSRVQNRNSLTVGGSEWIRQSWRRSRGTGGLFSVSKKIRSWCVSWKEDRCCPSG